MDDLDLIKDAKYKSFVAQIDKSLRSFDYSNEWADLISALGRLIKIIQSNTKCGYIPRHFIIGKRLAQCLHPALPAGVHCKVLECYDVIFRTIGSERVAYDLPIYGPGLFALLEPSAMTVKSPLFDIYEEHLLPLGKLLHPSFLGLLKGLLPGLEPGAEFSERGNRMLEMFSFSVGPAFFYTCLWKLFIRCSSIRQYGISFILNHLNKRKPLDSQNYIYGLDKNILIESLCCLFGDNVLLVQRDALDFVLLALPIHFYSTTTTTTAPNPFQSMTNQFVLTMKDFSMLCTASLSILLRRDASLNRRLFTWLKGSQSIEGMIINGLSNHHVGINESMTWADIIINQEENKHLLTSNENTSQCYFKFYSQTILIESVRCVIHKPTCLPISLCQFNENQLNVSSKSTFGSDLSALVTERSISERPFRVLVGLTEQPDIALGLLDNLLLDIMWYTYEVYLKLRWQTTNSIRRQKSSSSSSSSSSHRDSILTISDLVNRPSLNEKQLPMNMMNLIKDYILIRDSAKPTSNLRIDNPSKTSSLNSDHNGMTITSNHLIDKEDSTVSIDPNIKKMSTVHSTTTTATTTAATATTTNNVVDEFLRTAHLFFSNINSEFLWRFIENQFTELLNIGSSSSLSCNGTIDNSTTTATVAVQSDRRRRRRMTMRTSSMEYNNNSNSNNTNDWHQSPLNLSLIQWCCVIDFFLNCFPMDMLYSNVCGCYLPRLLIHLIDCLVKKLRIDCEVHYTTTTATPTTTNSCLPVSNEENFSKYQLTPSEWASLIGCLDAIVHHIREYAVTIFDQLSSSVNCAHPIESLTSITNQNNSSCDADAGNQGVAFTGCDVASSSSTSGNNQISEELTMIAKAVGQFRQFLGIFCIHVLNFSPVKMNEFIQNICMEPCQHDVFSISMEKATSTMNVTRSKHNTTTNNSNNQDQLDKEAPANKSHEKSAFMQNQSIISSPSSSISCIDLFAQICRLIVEMSNFPLSVMHQYKNSTGNTFNYQSEMNLLDLFGGELIRQPNTGDYLTKEFIVGLQQFAMLNNAHCYFHYSLGCFILPQWLVCLLYASCNVDNFNIKSIALYTLIELFHAAISIHGWNTELPCQLSDSTAATTSTTNDRDDDHSSANDTEQIHSGKMNKTENKSAATNGKHQVNQGMRLVFPVLSGELMAYLSQSTNLFTYLGISLWHYLSPEYSAYHEDTTSLLVRLHQLAPPMPKSISIGYQFTTNTTTTTTTSPSGGAGAGGGSATAFSNTISSCIENFILSQMLSSNLTTKIDAQSRFILLWHLMRYYGSRGQSTTSSSSIPVAGSRRSATTAAASATHESSFSRQQQQNGFYNSITAVSWRRRFLCPTESKKSIGHSDLSAGLNLYDIPFYRCTLLLLDNLDYDNPPLNPIDSVKQNIEQLNQTDRDHDHDDHPINFGNSILHDQSVVWIEKALRTGQIDRLIVPILAILLHPATARISLKSHVLKHYYCEQMKITKSKKLFVNNLSNSMKTDTDCKPPSYEEVVNAMNTTSNTNSQLSTTVNTMPTENASNLMNNGTVGAQLQQVDSSMELTDKSGRTVINELNTTTTTTSTTTTTTSSKQQTAEAILNSVLSMRLMQDEESHSLLDYVTDWHENCETLTMLPVNEHLLVYLQNYDANQVIYAFSRLRSILCIKPDLFVRSLATCKINSFYSCNLYGLKFTELLTRHRRSMAGGNFFTVSTTDELNAVQHMYTNLLELLIDLCLQFMCSYLPFITTTTTTTTTSSSMNGTDQCSMQFAHRFHGSKCCEFSTNQFVQNTATDILRLIVQQLVCIQDECFNSPLINSTLKTNSNVSNVKNSSSSARLSEISLTSSSSSSVLYSTGLTNSNNVPPNTITFTSMIQQANGRRLVQTTLYHTCLTSAVLHCLASCMIKVHWPKYDKNWSDYSQPNGIKKLPTCLQLILVNDLLANLPNSFYTTQLQSLLHLFNVILHLKPWYGYADRLTLMKYYQLYPPPQQNNNTQTTTTTNTTTNTTLMELSSSNVLWPIRWSNTLLLSPSASSSSSVSLSPMANHDDTMTNTDVLSLISYYMNDIWLKAFNKLPTTTTTSMPTLNNELSIFRLNCLTILYSSNTTSNRPNVNVIEKDQVNLFMELLSIGLSSPSPSPSLSSSLSSSTSHQLNFFTARLDLHSLWYHFIFHSLSYWGWFIGTLIRVTIKQICSSINKLCNRFFLCVIQNNSTMIRSQLSTTNEWDYLPPDYTLNILALIQGICHAFLLSVGNTPLPLLPTSSRKANSLHQPTSTLLRPLTINNHNTTNNNNPPTVSQLTGLPDSLEGVVEIAEILYRHKLNPPNSTGSSSIMPTEVNNNSNNTSNNNIVPAFDPLFPSPLTENVDLGSTMPMNSSNSSSIDNNHMSDMEPSVILTSRIEEDKLSSKDCSNQSPNPTVIFLNRVKNSQNVNIKDDILNPELHPYVQAQFELLRLMPEIVSSISLLWNTLNQSTSSLLTTKRNFYKSNHFYQDKEQCPLLNTPIPPENLSSIISLGSPTLVRGAIRRLLKPIAAQHPDLVLITTAVAWPNTTFDIETGGLMAGVDSLANYGPLDMLIPVRTKSDYGNSEFYSIPLHQKQLSLLDLITGRTYDDRNYGPILSATVLIHHLRDSIRRPLNSINNNSLLAPIIHSSSSSSSSSSSVQSGCNPTPLFSPVGSFTPTQEFMPTPISMSLNECKTVVSNISNINNTNTNTNNGLNLIRLQINLLHLFYAWLIIAKTDFISSDLLLILIKDLIMNMPTMLNYNSTALMNIITTNTGLGLTPAAIFILIKIFGKFLETASSSDDKREQKELQELCHRLLESTAAIAASALHQPSWFRKTLQVRQFDGDLSNASLHSQPLNSIDSTTDRLSLSGSDVVFEPLNKSDRIAKNGSSDLTDSPVYGQSTNMNSVLNNDIEQASMKDFSCRSISTLVPPSSSACSYYTKSRHSSVNLLTHEITRIRMRSDVTIQAMELLTENMAIFLDLVYRSDEKDRVSTFLNNILYNIFPYLRVRILSNSDHFTVASKLIASISSYQYTRKSWRREVFDLFYESVFFQMTSMALQSWNIIIDNLMTQDKSTFKEALARLVFTQPGGLNLFTSKETEYDLRAACLKKLSYIVYASEPDQYAKAMPDLLERLTECLRLGQGIIPVVHTQVFLFARVLISRMSAIQLTSLWPIVVPELVSFVFS
ncbi:unnamed protein product [Schistosoma turkestanicum]|nr:unnamed protein product [Schistosoma turkestanicum]